MIVACAVCFAGTDPGMRASLNAGIGVLMGVTVVVLAAFAFFFVTLARRARAAAARQDDALPPRSTPGAVTVPGGVLQS